MKTFAIVTALSISLAGCLSYPADWTPEQIAQYEAGITQRNAAFSQSMGQTTQGILNQTAQTPAPQAVPYGQPRSTTIVQCTDLTTQIAACQVR